jgi:fructoselysine 6-kinase
MDEMKVPSAVAVGFSCVDVYEKLGKCYPTGNGVDWGVHLSRLGIPVSVVSVAGDDAYGKAMHEMLEAEGVDTSHLATAHGQTCQMKMDLKDGVDRVHLEEIEGVMADFTLTDEDKAYIKTFDYLHTDLFGNVLGDLAELHDAGVKVVMDFSVFAEDPEYNDPANYANVDYAFLSCEHPDEHVRELLKEIQAQGPALVTATFGEEGSLAFDGERYYEGGIMRSEVVNTVGAGDSYIAGFTYGVMRGWEVPVCQALGAVVSSKVVSKFEPY